MRPPKIAALALAACLAAPLLFATGCTTRKHASFGHPGAFIYRQPLETVGLALMEEFKAQGYSVAPGSSARRLVFEKKRGAGGVFLHGDWTGTPVYTRVIIDIQDQGDGQKLTAEVRNVRGRDDFAVEESSWSMAGSGSEAQKILDKVEARFPAAPENK
jgi:urease alpha subunit